MTTRSAHWAARAPSLKQMKPSSAGKLGTVPTKRRLQRKPLSRSSSARAVSARGMCQKSMLRTCVQSLRLASTKPRICAPTKAVSIGKPASSSLRTGPSIMRRKNTFAAMPRPMPQRIFSILKRGIYGIYQHVSEEHLHRYLAEFDFRHNNRIALGVDDIERTDRAIRGKIGKRLTYRTTNQPIA